MVGKQSFWMDGRNFRLLKRNLGLAAAKDLNNGLFSWSSNRKETLPCHGTFRKTGHFCGRYFFQSFLKFPIYIRHFIVLMYWQYDDVAMGSPLGPALANIFVCFYEGKLSGSTSKLPSILFWSMALSLFSKKGGLQPFPPKINCFASISIAQWKINNTDIVLKISS